MTFDQAEAIKLITKVDFVRTQCVPSCKAGTLGMKLSNWTSLREPHEFCRYMQHYRLHSLAHNRNALLSIAEAFRQASKSYEGVVVDISIVEP